MINIIKDLFILHDYEQQLSDDIVLFKPKKTTQKLFWLVIAEDDPKNVLEKQSQYLATCKKLLPDVAVDKNTNVICLWQTKEMNKQSIARIHEVEEDLYFFKKHVLYYTAQELEAFKEELIDSPLPTMLAEKVNDSAVFDEYKHNIDTVSWQLLLYRIVIKLSFITIQNADTGDIEDLLSMHQASLNSNKNGELFKAIESIVLDDKFEHSEMAPDELLSDLLLQLKAAGHDI